MSAYRGEIMNEDGKVIFSRIGDFNSGFECLVALCKRISMDVPSVESFCHNAVFGVGFKNSPYCLSNCYQDIKKLTLIVKKI